VGEGEWIEERIRTWTEATARQAGLGEGHLAEAFQVVLTP
jgi:hypothetical protein